MHATCITIARSVILNVLLIYLFHPLKVGGPFGGGVIGGGGMGDGLFGPTPIIGGGGMDIFSLTPPSQQPYVAPKEVS